SSMSLLLPPGLGWLRCDGTALVSCDGGHGAPAPRDEVGARRDLGTGDNGGMAQVPPRLRPLLDAASPVQELARLLVDAGHECYLVGGSVRDAFLDRVVRHDEKVDVDVTTDARPDDVERLLRPWADHVWLQGKQFGTVGCTRGDTTIEVTTFRA